MASSTRCATASSRRLDGFDLTGALEAIWSVVRRLNRYVEERAPWELAKDDAQRRRARRACSTTSPTACARSRSRSRRTCRRRAPRILEALGQPRTICRWERVAHGRGRAADGIEPAPPLFPRVEPPAAAA